MRINHIELKDFGKFTEWGFDILERKLVFVVGRNGSGKSTAFVESLIWGLYGSNWKGVSSDAVIRDGAERCIVRVVTDDVVIEREKWRGKGAVIKVNDRVVGGLNGIVKISKDVFLNSVIFGAGISGFLNLSDSDRKEVVAEYVGGEVDGIVERLKERGKEIEKELKDVKEQVVSKERDLRAIQEAKGKVQIDEDVERLKRDKEELQRKLQEVEGEVFGLRSNIEQMQEQLQELELRYKELLKEGEGVQREVFMVEAKIKEIDRQVEKLRGLSLCLECFQEVGEEHKAKTLEKLRKEREELEEELKNREEVFIRVKTELDLLEKERYNKRQGLELERGRLEGRLKERGEIEGDLKVVEERLKQVEELENIQRELEERERVLQEEIQALLSREEVLQEKSFIIKWWVDKLVQYKSQVFNQVIKSFSEVVNDFLIQLTERFSVKLDYSVSGVKRISERLGLRVYDGGREVEWKRLSNGERRLVSLALNLCLNYVTSKVLASSWNIVVFDEVFDGLDSGIRGRVFRFLSRLVDRMEKSIIVITHDEFEGLVYDDKVQVVRF